MILTSLLLPFPSISPVAFSLGPLTIYWYGIAYMVGTFLAWGYMGRLIRRYPNGIDRAQLDASITWVLFSAILGGRLGYVLFYDPWMIGEAPHEILMTWKGGMSFHGGVLGVMIGVWILSIRQKISYFRFLDLVTTALPIALFLGRIANFINGEMYGRPSTMPWAVVFPNVDALSRHPSQLYEALLEGGVLGIFLWILYTKTSLRKTPGKMTGVFLAGYAVCRIGVEAFKEPEFWVGSLTAGQAFCIPMIVVGSLLLRRKSVSSKG